MSHARVYLHKGVLSHLLHWGVSPNDGAAALCGRSPWPGYWYGTGTQDEWELAAALPLCAGCKGKVSNAKV